MYPPPSSPFFFIIVAMEQLHADGMLKQRSFWILIGFLVVAPLSCCQSLDALKYTSSLSITFILFLAIMVVLFAFPSFTRLDPCIDYRFNGFCRGNEELVHLDTSSLRALSVFVFGYTCQQVQSYPFHFSLIYFTLHSSSLPSISFLSFLLFSSFHSSTLLCHKY